MDRLGSVRGNKYLPYGEEVPATANDKDKFATYFRDSSTGLDYAMNRYYGSNLGRFLTPDPYLPSAKTENPSSWNRYSYVESDPVNKNDPSGLFLPGDYNPFDSGGFHHNPLWWWFYNRPTFHGLGNPPSGDPGGGGGGGAAATNPTPAQPQNRDLLADAVQEATRALGNYDCWSLFGDSGTREGSFNPPDLLQSISPTIAFEDKGKGWGVARVENRTGRPTIIINTFNDANQYWNDGNVVANAHTLLHELGHWYDSNKGSGGSDLHTPDSFPRIFGGDRKSRWNDWLIDQKCFGGALAYPDPGGVSPEVR